MPWWTWAVAAALIALAELHAPGYYLIWIALGAALTALVELLWHLPLEGQLISFVIGCLICCLGGFQVYRWMGLRSTGGDAETLNRRDRSMVGEHGAVSAAIVNGQGKVRVGDTVWLAEGPDLPEGAQVTVASVRGARLIVKPGGG